MKVSVSQDYTVNLTTFDGTGKRYPMKTGTISANTWTKITKTIPGDSGIDINNDTGKGMAIMWYPYLGNSYVGGSSINTWSTANVSNFGGSPDTSWYTTNDATFEITGVQVEVGEHATPFEHLRFEDDLRRCQRYCQVTDGGGCGVGVCGGSAAGYRIQMQLKETMRAAPTVTKVGSNIYIYDGSAAVQVSGTSQEYGTPHAMEWEFDSLAAGDPLTSGRPVNAYINGSAGGFKMESEL